MPAGASSEPGPGQTGAKFPHNRSLLPLFGKPKLLAYHRLGQLSSKKTGRRGGLPAAGRFPNRPSGRGQPVADTAGREGLCPPAGAQRAPLPAPRCGRREEPRTSRLHRDRFRSALHRCDRPCRPEGRRYAGILLGSGHRGRVKPHSFQSFSQFQMPPPARTGSGNPS